MRHAILAFGILLCLLMVSVWGWERWGRETPPHEEACEVKRDWWTLKNCARGDWLDVPAFVAPHVCDFARQVIVIADGVLCQYVGYLRKMRTDAPTSPRSTPPAATREDAPEFLRWRDSKP